MRAGGLQAPLSSGLKARRPTKESAVHDAKSKEPAVYDAKSNDAIQRRTDAPKIRLFIYRSLDFVINVVQRYCHASKLFLKTKLLVENASTIK